MEILHSGARHKCLFSVYKTRAAKAMANAVLAASGLLGARQRCAVQHRSVCVCRWEHMLEKTSVCGTSSF